MLMRRIFHNSLRLSFMQLCWIALAVTAVCCMFMYHGYYNYTHIPRSEVENNLYRARSPDYRLSRSGAQNDLYKMRNLEYDSTPECDYDFINSVKTTDLTENDMNVVNFTMDGIWNGSYSPVHCNPMFSSAILVTYRNREEQLKKFIPYIHTFLRNQNIHYKIFVIEQEDNKPWNKGALYNIGAKVAIAEKFPCLILHDVDLFPLDEANIYSCTHYPRHMSASINKFRYVLPYEDLVGGVAAIQSKHYVRVNGFSNRFQGWGGEDDDFARRIHGRELPIVRFPPQMSRYIMLHHRQEKRNKYRRQVLLDNEGHEMEDGFNSVKYHSMKIRNLRLYTLVGVQL